MSKKTTRCTAVFEFNGKPPAISLRDAWKGGEIVSIYVYDLGLEVRRLRSALQKISDGQHYTHTDAMEFAADTLEQQP
jgi:hypothetical protein